MQMHAVAQKTRHTNTSSCTRRAGGDAPQLALQEAGLQRDAQGSKPALLKPEDPVPREGPRLRFRRLWAELSRI